MKGRASVLLAFYTGVLVASSLLSIPAWLQVWRRTSAPRPQAAASALSRRAPYIALCLSAKSE